jgi:hypothetical protein
MTVPDIEGQISLKGFIRSGAGRPPAITRNYLVKNPKNNFYILNKLIKLQLNPRQKVPSDNAHLVRTGPLRHGSVVF